ncbi:MAG: glycolate oxidase subunit GlcE [Gammaproteobacteria bacterium]|nr:glycolate oxidase subunit GlcE [Gammaproteobacteria bacterium]
MTDIRELIASRVKDACEKGCALKIHAGNTKDFYGRNIKGIPLSLSEHTGIVEYEPSELYITARSGTPLKEIEHVIEKEKQILPCEPPHFGAAATVGGMVAAGLSGPRRVSSGAIRDCILGVEIINGKGEYLQFGGKVMKNVAGYDVSRLMCGALGTLGILMSVTLRLLPKPVSEQTLAFPLNTSEAIQKMNSWTRTPMPITGTFHDSKNLYIRLAGSRSTIEKCAEILGGDMVDRSHAFWSDVKEQAIDFFMTDKPIWRIQVPPNTTPLKISGSSLLEWNGALRWYASETEASEIRRITEQAGGHACLFRRRSGTEDIFHPLSPHLLEIHRRLKRAFDPNGILNPGKIYCEF